MPEGVLALKFRGPSKWPLLGTTGQSPQRVCKNAAKVVLKAAAAATNSYQMPALESGFGVADGQTDKSLIRAAK